MSTYAVIGGTGTVGGHIVEALREQGEAVRVLSRHSREHPVDLSTGAGLDDAFRGADVVIDASNGDSRRPEAVHVDGASRLMQAAARAGVGRIVGVSIVGIDAVPMRYYRAKVAQEQVLRGGPVPATIVRSTQFHELIDTVLSFLARLHMRPRAGFPLEPIAAAEAARAVAAVARQAPAAPVVSVAGPERLTVDELARLWRAHYARRLVPVPLPLPPRAARPLRAGALTAENPEHRGELTFASWLHTAAL